MKPKSPRPSCLVVASLAALLAGSASAQACAVRNGYRIVNSHSGVGSELSVDTGWQTAAPLVTPGYNVNPGSSCFSQGSCIPTSDYGYLNCTGMGAANNCGLGGTFLILDQGPQARFRDTMTLTSTTLPFGAPVQVRAIITIDGFANVVDTTPFVSYVMNFTAAAIGVGLTSAPGTATGIINTTVGGSVQLAGNLAVNLGAGGIQGFGNPPSFASYSMDLTGRVGLTCLTPGVSMSFCSGHTYESLAASVSQAGGGCGAGSPVMSATLPLLGQTENYTVASSAANQLVYFAYSFGNPQSNPMGTCTITEDLASVVLVPVGTTDGAGVCGFGLFFPAAPWLAGLTLTTQALVLSPGGPLLGIAQLSNGLVVTLGL